MLLRKQYVFQRGFVFERYLNKKVGIILNDKQGIYNGIILEVSNTHLVIDDRYNGPVTILLESILKIESRGVKSG